MIEALLLFVLTVLMGIFCELKLIKHLLRGQLITDTLKEEREQIEVEHDVNIEPSYPQKKATIYTPSSDPISEFTGQRDDWYGEKNE